MLMSRPDASPTDAGSMKDPTPDTTGAIRLLAGRITDYSWEGSGNVLVVDVDDSLGALQVPLGQRWFSNLYRTDNTSREAQRRNDWMLSFCGSPRSRSRASRNQNQPP